VRAPRWIVSRDVTIDERRLAMYSTFSILALAATSARDEGRVQMARALAGAARRLLGAWGARAV
jgi:hypothetical protein